MEEKMNDDLVSEFRHNPMLAREFLDYHESRSILDSGFVFFGSLVRTIFGLRIAKIVLRI